MAAVLISFGGMIGKITSTQLIWLCVIEITLYSLNAAICFEVRPWSIRSWCERGWSGRSDLGADAAESNLEDPLVFPLLCASPQAFQCSDAGGSIVIHVFGK